MIKTSTDGKRRSTHSKNNQLTVIKNQLKDMKKINSGKRKSPHVN